MTKILLQRQSILQVVRSNKLNCAGIDSSEVKANQWDLMSYFHLSSSEYSRDIESICVVVYHM